MGRKKNPYKPIYKEPLTKEAKLKILAIVMFWVVFAVFITCLFIINWPKIRTTMQNALWPAWFKSRTPQTNQAPASPEPLQLEDIPIDWDIQPSEPEPERTETLLYSAPQEASALAPQPVLQEPPTQVSLEPAPAQEDQPASPTVLSQPEEPTALLVSSHLPSQEDPPSMPRDRYLYFIQIDRNGIILRSKITRMIPSSNTPLLDVLQVLITGPTEEEKRQGLISLIPEGTEIISARVLKDTAYIDINENFQYNMYGVEGYAGQLTQLIWTATEFANVKDVQILIEGRRVDYLGEGIWIGSPITRDMF